MEIAHALQADVRYGHAALSRVKMKYGIVATLPLPGVLEKVDPPFPFSPIIHVSSYFAHAHIKLLPRNRE